MSARTTLDHHMTKTLGIASLGALLPFNGCVVQLKSSPENEDGGNGGVGGSSTTQPPDVADDEYEGEQLPACNPKAFSDAEKQAIVDKAIARFEAEQKAETGTGADSVRQAWNDEVKFARLVGYMYDEAGCSELREETPTAAGQSQQGLHNSNGPDYYCGPGHGSATLMHPPVSQCLNELCKLHDACYTMCNASTDKEKCSWDRNTRPCDDEFRMRASECEEFYLMDSLVRFLAGVLAAAGKDYSCGAMVCPPFGELGTGICATDPQNSDCTQCLRETDVGSQCFDHACGQAQDDPFCYTANCPNVSECYGGYGRGLPGATSPKETVADPDSRQWDVTLASAVLPEHTASGEEWDIGVAGYGPPDPYAVVTIADTTERTWRIREATRPDWGATFGPFTAQQLRNGLELEFWDEDIAFDDYMGGCSYAVSDIDFNEDHVTVACDAEIEFTITLNPR